MRLKEKSPDGVVSRYQIRVGLGNADGAHHRPHGCLLHPAPGSRLTDQAVQQLADAVIPCGGDLRSQLQQVVRVEAHRYSLLVHMQKDTGLAFLVQTLRLEAQGWVNVDEQYVEYLREVVVPYYQQAVEQMPGARFCWYSLAEAQLKARMPEDALKSIEKGSSIKGQGEDPAETSGFKQLRQKVLRN